MMQCGLLKWNYRSRKNSFWGQWSVFAAPITCSSQFHWTNSRRTVHLRNVRYFTIEYIIYCFKLKFNFHPFGTKRMLDFFASCLFTLMKYKKIKDTVIYNILFHRTSYGFCSFWVEFSIKMSAKPYFNLYWCLCSTVSLI